MTMMGKQHNLRRFPEFGQKPKRRRAAIVVEMHEQIVGNEWQRLGRRAILLDARDAEREKELIALPIAH
ncbi:MAG: hypothetical protein ACREDV_12260, partial [Methylocella sp.]